MKYLVLAAVASTCATVTPNSNVGEPFCIQPGPHNVLECRTEGRWDPLGLSVMQVGDAPCFGCEGVWCLGTPVCRADCVEG